MVKDILLNIKERDILIGDKSNQNEPCFDVEWENAKCIVKIPYAYSETVEYDDNDTFTCRVKIPYKPLASTFTFEIYVDKGEGYLLSEITGGTACTKPFYSLKPVEIVASQLIMLDLNGDFKVIFTKNSDKVMISSYKESDILNGASDNQSAQLIALCAPGKNYRYPTTGIDIVNYINSVVDYTDLQDKIVEQYEADGKAIFSADFDSITGNLETVFKGEDAIEEDAQLTDISDLKTDWLGLFSDANVRTFIDVDKRSFFGFQTIFNFKGNYLGLVLFPSDELLWERKADSILVANINDDGTTYTEDDYYMIEAELTAGSIIAFNMDNVSVYDNSMFFIDNLNVTDEYLSIAKRTNYSGHDYYNCAIINKDCTLRYSIKRTAYDKGDGIYLIEERNANIIRMMLIAIDDISGRNLGIVANNCVIEDLTLDEVVESYTMQNTAYSDILLDFESLNNAYNTNTINGAELTRLSDGIALNYMFNADGKRTRNTDYQIVQANIDAMSLIVFDLPDEYDSPIIFTLSNGTEVIFTDYPYIKDYRWHNKDCKTSAIVLRSCTIKYAIGKDDYANNYGIYTSKSEMESIMDSIIVTSSSTTGLLTGHVVSDGNITGIKLDRTTGEVIIIKE